MRVSTFSTFSRVLAGLRANQYAGIRAQEQLATGRRLIRPSDDPSGTARSLSLRRELSRTNRIQDSIATGRNQLELAATTLQQSSDLFSRARELVLQALNGTLTDGDRQVIAAELEELRGQLLESANLQVDGNYVFGGTRLSSVPWEEVTVDGITRVVYRGNQSEQQVQSGIDQLVAITIPGDQVFGRSFPGLTRYDGLTGVGAGTTADEGSGYGRLVFRNDSTDLGTLATAGIKSASGTDTLLGANRITIDAAAGTIQLGDGQPLTIPEGALRERVTIENELGGQVELDLTGWNGFDYEGLVIGNGSVALNGTDFTPLTFTETDLELRDEATGSVLHIDTTGVLRAGEELVTFGNTANPFDLLSGIVDDLVNDQGLDSGEVIDRLSIRLEDLDRIHDDLLLGMGTLGSRSARLVTADSQLSDFELELEARLSQVEDADLAEVATDLARSDLLLQLAQAAGARVMQTSLLNFLG
jgi:flagellin-like hook-associated protein FlgL